MSKPAEGRQMSQVGKVGNPETPSLCDVRSTEVTRNLICNPKLPLPEVERLLRPLSQDEEAKLSKSGRLRASVRQAILKRLHR